MDAKQFLDNNCIFSQRDPRWNRIPISNTALLLNDWGCTITALCRIIFRLTGKRYFPDKLATLLEFNSQGRVIWSSLKNVGLKAYRYGDFRHVSQPTSKHLSAISVSEDSAMLLEINNHSHWVAFEKNSIYPFLTVSDPLRGKIVKKLRSSISGYAVLTKLPTT